MQRKQVPVKKKKTAILEQLESKKKTQGELGPTENGLDREKGKKPPLPKKVGKQKTDAGSLSSKKVTKPDTPARHTKGPNKKKPANDRKGHKKKGK